MATSGDRLSPSTRSAAAQAPSRPDRSPAAGLAALDAGTIALVQASWARVMPISDAAATLFYDRLFALDPQVRGLFRSDLREQKKKLMQTLTVAVDGLGSLPRLMPVLEDLGARHAGYMVQDRHYALVGQALLWALREGLGDGFTPEVERAWAQVYGLVAAVMRRAGADNGVDPGEETVPTQLTPGAIAGTPPAMGEDWPSLELPSQAPPRPARIAGAAPAAGAPAWPPAERPDDGARVVFATGARPPDDRTIDLVQASWTRLVPISDAVATLFYDRLFALDPALRTLFKSDMREQRKKLMQTLSVAVDGVRTPAKLMPVLQNLGLRHAGYMVQDRHYDLVGQALMWTLREGLGDELTPELERAWLQVYEFVAGIMRRAAQPSVAQHAQPGPAAAPAGAEARAPDTPAAPAAVAAPAPVAAPAAVARAGPRSAGPRGA